MMSLLDMAKWLQETQGSISIRDSILMFPLLEGSHLLGIAVSAGTIAISDLRMMGLIFKKESASDVFHQLIPWTTAGFVMMMVTGMLLLWSEPVKLYGSIWFRYKVLFLFLAGLNVLIFHSSKVYRTIHEWATFPFQPYYDYCGTYQSWYMFGSAQRSPTRLHIDVEEDGVWRPVYVERRDRKSVV